MDMIEWQDNIKNTFKLNNQKVKSYEWISNHPLKLGKDWELIFKYGNMTRARVELKADHMDWRLINGKRPDSVGIRLRQ